MWVIRRPDSGGMICRVEIAMKRRRSAIAALVLFCAVPSAVIIGIAAQHDEIGDLNQFMGSGRASAAGLNPYNAEGWMNMNAPASLPLFHALALLDPAFPLAAVWVLASGLVYLGCLAMLLRQTSFKSNALAAGFSLAQSAFWATLWYGQIYILLLAFVVAAFWAYHRGHHTIAAVLIGPLVAIKPNFGLWPVLLFVGGYRREAFVSGASAILFCIPAALLYGPGIYPAWVVGARDRMPQELANHANATFVGVASRAGVPDLGLILSAALVMVMIWWAFRRRPDFSRLGMAALAAAVIAAPSGWLGYAVLLLPAFFRPWNRWLWLAAALLLCPFWVGISQPEPYHGIWNLTHPVILLLALAGVMTQREAGYSTSVRDVTQNALDRIVPVDPKMVPGQPAVVGSFVDRPVHHSDM